MTWAWIIAGVVVLMAVLALGRVLRRLVFAFALAAGLLLGLHAREHPGEAAAAGAAMVAGIRLARPVRRFVFGGVL